MRGIKFPLASAVAGNFLSDAILFTAAERRKNIFPLRRIFAPAESAFHLIYASVPPWAVRG
jgi:hypothetical protein